MAEGGSGMEIALDAMTGWLLDLRKELKDVRYRASYVEGLESLQLRVKAVETEAKLVEIYLSILTRPLPSVAKVPKSES